MASDRRGRETSEALSAALFEVLATYDPDRAEPASFLLSTTGGRGDPQLALLGAAEVYAPTEHSIRLAVWQQSSSAHSLGRDGAPALLTFVHGRAVHRIRLSSTGVTELPVPGHESLALVEFTIAGVSIDRVPYAVVETGVTFRVLDPVATRQRWERTHRALAQGG